jgi:hypothetical protein
MAAGESDWFGRVGIYRQVAKFAKVDLTAENLDSLGGLGVLAVVLSAP